MVGPCATPPLLLPVPTSSPPALTPPRTRTRTPTGCAAEESGAGEGWVDGKGQVKAGTHFLFTATPKGELLAEGEHGGEGTPQRRRA